MSQIKKGQKWRYIGVGSEYYTPGKLYDVLSEPTSADELFQMTDDRNGQPHHWSIGTLGEAFERADGPVRTVTRKEIVPGTYGKVHVGARDNEWLPIGITIDSSFNADELRAAAATLTEIADALGEAS